MDGLAHARRQAGHLVNMASAQLRAGVGIRDETADRVARIAHFSSLTKNLGLKPGQLRYLDVSLGGLDED
jgi:hypothetical protein